MQFKEQVGLLFLAAEKVSRKPLWYFDTLKQNLLSLFMFTRHEHGNTYVTSKEHLEHLRCRIYHLSTTCLQTYDAAVSKELCAALALTLV